MKKNKSKIINKTPEIKAEICNVDLESYQDIIEILLRWKVIPLTLLKDAVGFCGWDSSFRKMILNLEKRNVIKSFQIRGRAKFVYPTNELIKIKAHKISYGIYEESLRHEGLVTVTCHELLKWEFIKSVILHHEYNGKSFNRDRLEPDAILIGDENSESFKIGLEVELSRKSKHRVQDKILSYINSIYYDCVIYVMNNQSDFEAYKRNGTEIDVHHIYRDFMKAQKKAGLGRRIRFHDLRHTFASQFVMNGGSIFDLQKILGHTDIKMTMRYAHYSSEHLQNAMKGFELGEVLNESPRNRPEMLQVIAS